MAVSRATTGVPASIAARISSETLTKGFSLEYTYLLSGILGWLVIGRPAVRGMYQLRRADLIPDLAWLKDSMLLYLYQE